MRLDIRNSTIPMIELARVFAASNISAHPTETPGVLNLIQDDIDFETRYQLLNEQQNWWHQQDQDDQWQEQWT